MIQQLWKNLRFQTQLLIMQCSIVAIIFVILISSCLYLIQLFSVFIKQELLQSLVLNSMVSTIHSAVIRVDKIGLTEYYINIAERQGLKNLFNFQVDNNIEINSLLDNCLQTPHSQQFYTYQICYGIYGQDKNLTDYNYILNAMALQNQFLPFISRKQIVAYYNIKFGKSIFLSQYQGKFIYQLDQQLLDALNYMENSQDSGYYQQQNLTGKVFLSLSAVDKNSLYMGALLNQSESPYNSMINSDQYFNQRQLIFLDSGFILADTSNDNAFGQKFQNTSVSGFNIQQFEMIKNFAKKNKTINSECQLKYKSKVICLINTHGLKQLVFSKYVVNGGFYIIIIVDTIFLNQIENDFNQQLFSLIDNLLLKIGIQYLTAFLICIILQIAFIKKLNRPLEHLQNVAKSHINNYQHTIQKIISVSQTQNQTQKLADAFFNLINLINSDNNNQRRQLQFAKDLECQAQKGTILRRQTQKIIIEIRKQIWKQCGLQKP